MVKLDDDLKISEGSYKTLFTLFPEPLYLWKKVNDNLVLIDSNDAGFYMTNGNIGKYMGITASNMYKNNPEILHDLHTCIDRKTSLCKKMHYEFKSIGKKKILLVYYTFIPPDLVLIYTLDKTAEERAERELRESQQLLDKILKASSVGIAYSINRKIIWANDSMAKLFGFNKEEQYKNKDTHILYPNEAEYERIGKLIYEQLSSRDMVELDAKLKKQDGTVFDGYIRVNFLNPSNPNKGLIVSIIDITERKEVESKLRESEEKFRLITEQSLVGICILQDNVYKYVNDQFLEIIGYSQEEIEQWKPGDFLMVVHPEFREYVKVQAEKKQRGFGDYEKHYEFKGIRKNGEVFWAEIYSQTVPYKGRTADLVSTIDITNRKYNELRLQESEKKYEKTYNRAEFYKDLFAHDINNILQNILSAGDLLKLYHHSPEYQHKVSGIIDILEFQVLRGANLVSNIRKLSLLDKKNYKLYLLSLKPLLQKAISHLKARFPSKQMEITLNHPNKDMKVYANEFLLDVFQNLLMNAVEFNDNLKICIEINVSKILDKKTQTQHVKVQFIDNARGIEEDRKEQIFQRSYSHKEKGKGMGLGLSLVKKIIDTYNATITVKNRIKKDYTQGSNFIICFPCNGS
ncbi:MAG: putative Histidine kinase [Promethearchaeota archaeon]|nr:MAG: putative Histidine kinase [Candidatus Lokiarchaeota archaeon]